MLAFRLVRLARLDRLRSETTITDRALALTFAARFTDEVTSGAWGVLTPAFRSSFGLSLLQVGLLTQVLTWVALAVEPVAAGLIDVASRRRLMAFGAGALALSMLVMAVSPSYAVLLVAVGLTGVGSGPLAHTADVVVVESFPDAPERAYARATFLDTTGAMLGPAFVAVAAGVGVSWRAVLLVLAAGCALYAWTIARTSFPAPPAQRDEAHGILAGTAVAVRAALAQPAVRRAVFVLFCFEVFEAAFVLEFIWLHDAVGLGEGAIAVWAVAEEIVGLVALVLLDRWLRTVPASFLLRVATGALVALPALWVLAPGVWGRVAVGLPLAFAYAFVWPLAKSRSLMVAPERAGATQAVTTLFPVLPLALVESLLAQAIGIGAAMALTAAVGAAGMLATSGPGGER